MTARGDTPRGELADTPAYLEPGTCACGREMGFCDTNCLKCECYCERMSICCGASEHRDVENFCAACSNGTGFECALHDVEWPDTGLCPAVRERELAMAERCDQ